MAGTLVVREPLHGATPIVCCQRGRCPGTSPLSSVTGASSETGNLADLALALGPQAAGWQCRHSCLRCSKRSVPPLRGAETRDATMPAWQRALVAAGHTKMANLRTGHPRSDRQTLVRPCAARKDAAQKFGKRGQTRATTKGRHGGRGMRHMHLFLRYPIRHLQGGTKN